MKEQLPQGSSVVHGKASRRINFDFIVTNLRLPKGPRICVLDLRAGSRIMESSSDRSVLIEDAVLVLVCRKGSCVATVEGCNYTLAEGQLLLVFANTFCRFSSPSHDFDASTLVGHVNPQTTYNSIAANFPQIIVSPVVKLDRREVSTLLSLLDYAKNSLRRPQNSHRTELDLGIMSALHDEIADILLHRKFEAQGLNPSERIVERFRLMLSVSNFEHRDVEYYATQFNLSPKRFATIVKSVTGVTPLSMITSALIVAAKRMLVCTDLTTSEISDRLNFATPSFFCRYFRRYTGQTPMEWRNIYTQK